MHTSFLINRPFLGAIAMSLVVSAALAPSHSSAQSATDKVVVAHRGASGYLPEHTLAAKAMAYAMGADYIEQDVVMTKDDQLIIIHDITLDRTTDVAEKFADRARTDGHYYAMDFTLEEILTLNVTEGFGVVNGDKVSNYPSRFPVGGSIFKIHTLAQEIELVQGLNHSTGGDVGIYPEIKSPAFHHSEGKDLSTAVVTVLKEYGYTSKNDNIFVQTFEFDELMRLHDEVLPALGVELKLVQLLSNGIGNKWMQTADGIKRIARYADGVGPEKGMIIDPRSTEDNLIISDLVKFAHDNDMQVHPYTFRLDPGQLPAYAYSYEQMLEQFYFKANIDGVFTDFPDRAVTYLKER